MSEEVTKEKKKNGRPTIFNQQLSDEICRRLSLGETMTSVCNDAGMPDYNTLWRWMKEDEKFRDESAHARELGTHALADQCIAIADDPILDPADKRIRIDTRIRLIGKWNQKKYGDKIELESNNNQNLTLSFNVPNRGNEREVIELENAEPLALKQGEK